jgi:hypothetical protein
MNCLESGFATVIWVHMCVLVAGVPSQTLPGLNPPRRLAVKPQQPLRKLVFMWLLLIREVLLENPAFVRVRTLL